MDPDPTDSVTQILAQTSETVKSTSNPAQSLIRSGKNHLERGRRSKSWACGQGTDEADEHLGERQSCGGEREPQAHRGGAPQGPRARAPPPPARRHLRSARCSAAAADEIERILLDLIVLLHLCSLRLCPRERPPNKESSRGSPLLADMWDRCDQWVPHVSVTTPFACPARTAETLDGTTISRRLETKAAVNFCQLFSFFLKLYMLLFIFR